MSDRQFFAGLFAVVALLLGSIGGGGYLVDRYACATRADLMDLGWEHRPLGGGCYLVLPDGRVVPRDSIRFNEAGR